jgi:hypothetical protein
MHVIFSASWGSISDEVAPLIFSSKNLVFLLPSLLPNFSVCFIHGDPVKRLGEELRCLAPAWERGGSRVLWSYPFCKGQ